MADLESTLSQLQQQNAELQRTLLELLKATNDLRRDIDRLSGEYYKHSHAALDALPS
jgi:prefoldin subunit 5